MKLEDRIEKIKTRLVLEYKELKNSSKPDKVEKMNTIADQLLIIKEIQDNSRNGVSR